MQSVNIRGLSHEFSIFKGVIHGAVMLYGFENLNLPRIVAIAQPPNLPSIRVMEKLKMHFEKMGTDRRGIEVVYYAKSKQGIKPVL
ncbi:hypothetical protein NUACC21_63820 [Scytonema sp. NUACC21]